MSFSDNLKAIMAREGISSSDLANGTGINTKTVESWLDGSKTPYAALKGRLCETLHCTEEELFISDGDIMPAPTAPKEEKKENPVRETKKENSEAFEEVPETVTGHVEVSDEIPPELMSKAPRAKKGKVESSQREAAAPKKAPKPRKELDDNGEYAALYEAMRSTGHNLKGIPKKPDAHALTNWCEEYLATLTNGINIVKSVTTYIDYVIPPTIPAMSDDAMTVAVKYDSLSAEEKKMVRKLLS